MVAGAASVAALLMGCVSLPQSACISGFDTYVEGGTAWTDTVFIEPWVPNSFDESVLYDVRGGVVVHWDTVGACEPPQP